MKFFRIFQRKKKKLSHDQGLPVQMAALIPATLQQKFLPSETKEKNLVLSTDEKDEKHENVVNKDMLKKGVDQKNVEEKALIMGIKGWYEVYFSEAVKAISEINLPWLALLLGPDLLKIKFQFEQEMRDNLFSWRHEECEKNFYEKALEIVSGALTAHQNSPQKKTVLSSLMIKDLYAKWVSELYGSIQQQQAFLKTCLANDAKSLWLERQGAIDQKLIGVHYLAPLLKTYRLRLDKLYKEFFEKPCFKRFLSQGNLSALHESLNAMVQTAAAKVVENNKRKAALKTNYESQRLKSRINYESNAQDLIKNHPECVPEKYLSMPLPQLFQDILGSGIADVHLSEMKDKEGNTLIHHALGAYYSASALNKGKLLPVVELLLKHHCLPYLTNYQKQNAFEYAAFEKIPSVSKPLLPDWPLVILIIQNLPTYTPLSTKIKETILLYSKTTQADLKSRWKWLFFNWEIKANKRLEEVGSITQHLHGAQQALVDDCLKGLVKLLISRAPRGHEYWPRSALYRDLKTALAEESERHHKPPAIYSLQR